MTSFVSTFTLDMSTLSSALMLDESHTVQDHFYGDQEGMIPTLKLYLEIYLAEEYRIDHFEILDRPPLILEAELYLYFTSDGRLVERFLPRLVDWERHLQDILDSIRNTAAPDEDQPAQVRQALVVNATLRL